MAMAGRIAGAAALPSEEETEQTQAAESDKARRLVEDVFGNLKEEVGQAEARLAREFERLAHFIEAAKSEIATLRPDDISRHHLPKVAVELDAITEAMERATHTIMSAAEKIEAIATAGLPAEQAAQVTAAITGIYEACGFQDISGQRIAKAVKTLKRIDDRVTVLVASIEQELAKQTLEEPDSPEEREGYAGEHEILSGPQSGPGATTQAEIDRLLAALGKPPKGAG
jgi:chemotaxis protein CheZ